MKNNLSKCRSLGTQNIKMDSQAISGHLSIITTKIKQYQPNQEEALPLQLCVICAIFYIQ